MKIRWDYNENTTSDCYKKTSADIKRGFYQRNRFYVLPYLPDKFRDRVVFFPEVDSSEAYDKYIKPYKRTLKELIKETSEVLPKFSEYCTKYISKEDFDITISPTYFGSVGRYDLGDGNNILLLPRFDRNITEIFCLIVTAIVEGNFPKVKSDKQWREKQKVTEGIFESQGFREIFPGVKDMVEILNENSTGVLATESATYLEQLGHPIKPYIKDANQIEDLTRTEREVLSLLLKNRSKLVTYEDLAVSMWGDKATESYSLFAISKIIDRLRGKIKQSGIKQNLIDSQRKKGYVLYD